MLIDDLKPKLMYAAACSHEEPFDPVAVAHTSTIDNTEQLSGDDHEIVGPHPNESRLRNLFLTQRFRDWLGYEWLYSPIDREIFLGPNDFQSILREQFPHMKTNRLVRGQWAIIRRMIGRPRRFSNTFLLEERDSVRGKRRNLRYLQHIVSNGSLDSVTSAHLDTLLTCFPLNTRIPVRFPIGTKVCVRLYAPTQGLAVGVIQDMCSYDGQYGVCIQSILSSNCLNLKSLEPTNQSQPTDRNFRYIPDEDVFVLPHQSVPNSIPLSSLACGKENIPSGSCAVMTSNKSNLNMVTSLTSSRSSDSMNNHHDMDTSEIFENLINISCSAPSSNSGGPLLNDNVCSVAGYPMNLPSSVILDPQADAKLFDSLAKLFNLVGQKRKAVETLKQMNDDAERKLSENAEDLTVQFKHTYATLILQLDKLNRELRSHMDIVITYITTIAQEQNMLNLHSITDWRRRCDDEAHEMVSRIRLSQNTSNLDDCKLALVSKLSCLVIHLCNLSDNRFLSQSLVCIDDLLNEIRHYLHPSNYECFQSTVERYINLIIHAITDVAQPRFASAQPARISNMYSAENLGSG